MPLSTILVKVELINNRQLRACLDGFPILAAGICAVKEHSVPFSSLNFILQNKQNEQYHLRAKMWLDLKSSSVF